MTDTDNSSRDRERQAIGRLRGTFERCHDDAWLLEAAAGEMKLIVRRSTGEDAHVCTIHADALDDERDLICGALDNLSLFLRLFDRAAATVRDLRGGAGRGGAGQQAPKEREKDYAANAAMLLAERSFQRFLETISAGGPVRDKAQADTRLKSLLAISSKTFINRDSRAQAAFLRLRADYYAWKTGGPR